jgi:mannose-6-phosphate isomerase-like protein (cupin superfamily)
MGVLSAYLLNLVRLEPGQAMYLPAGELHAYLGKLNPKSTDEGFGMELMANSDNVLRGGLTPKHIDVPELLSTLTFSSGMPKVLLPESRSETEGVYKTGAEEFELSVIEIKKDEEFISAENHSADALIVLEGSIEITDSKGEVLDLDKGKTLLVPAASGKYTIRALSDSAKLYKASLPSNTSSEKTAMTAKEEKLKEIEERMDALNKMYLKLIPPVKTGTTLVHLVSIDLIPYQMRDEFVSMINDVNRNFPDMKEKIYVLTDRQDAGHMINKLNDEADGACVFDVALADTDNLDNIPEGVKALVFAGKLGNFRQLSGMLAALRALQQDEAGSLIKLFEILTGKPFEGTEADILEVINDPKELAKIIIFNLRPVDSDLTVDDLAPLNRKLLAFIKAA